MHACEGIVKIYYTGYLVKLIKLSQLTCVNMQDERSKQGQGKLGFKSISEREKKAACEEQQG